MKNLCLFIVLSLSLTNLTQSQSTSLTIQETQTDETAIYELYPTQNYWTFIKLDTRNGKMWQVHFTVEEGGKQETLVLNSLPLPLYDDVSNVAGRFKLYPTENIYNFLLMDKFTGDVYQIQWSMEEKNRGIVHIF